MLVGLIPGPPEPAHDLNSFLEPLVEDLLHFWDGIELSIPTSSAMKKIRCALPYSGNLSWDKSFAFLVNFQFDGENFREWGWVYMWSRGTI